MPDHDKLRELFDAIPDPPPCDIVPPSREEIRAVLDAHRQGTHWLTGCDVVDGPDGPVGVDMWREQCGPPVIHPKDRERLEQELRDQTDDDERDTNDD